MKNIPNTTHSGFTLVELMIVVAILGVLVAIALPAYETYANRSQFAEAPLAATPVKSAIEVAIQTKDPVNLAALSPGAMGIPTNSAPTATAHGVTVNAGVITVTWKSDGSALDGVTYTLTPDGVASPVTWSQGGTCLAKNFC